MNHERTSLRIGTSETHLTLLPKFRHAFRATLLALLLTQVAFADEAPKAQSVPSVGQIFRATDTLVLDAETNADAKDCLAGLRWTPAPFEVQCEPAAEDRGDMLVRFPSPLPAGDPVNDNVSMEWYVARDADRKPMRAHPMIIVYESGRGMTVGRIFAKGLQAQGFHTFLIHLPGYGARKSELSGKTEMILQGMRQAIGDVRRAKDAAVSLPLVDGSRVGIQGTSLGGFITSTVAGVDRGFDRVFILLAGGNLHQVVLNGTKDAAKVRERLEALGFNGQKIEDLSRPVEPLRLASRINPQTTWLYSGKYDDVVPPACSFALADAAKLPAGHHIELLADHYSGVVFLPMVIVEIRKRMLDDEAETLNP